MVMGLFAQNKAIKSGWAEALLLLMNAVLNKKSMILADFVKIYARGFSKSRAT